LSVLVNTNIGTKSMQFVF